MVNLAIQHYIHLTRDQRYRLHSGGSIIQIGVSIPVWFVNKYTSEPGKEVFCRYYLHNTLNDSPIKILNDGYEIFIPKRNHEPLAFSNEEWREINFHNPAKLDVLYERCVCEASTKNLLDVADGGSGTLFYREHSEMSAETTRLQVVHYVTLAKVETLRASLN